MAQVTGITHIRDDWKFDLDDIEKMVNITKLPFQLDYLTVVCREDDAYPDAAFIIENETYITLNVHPSGDATMEVKDRLREYAQNLAFEYREPAELYQEEDEDDCWFD